MGLVTLVFTAFLWVTDLSEQLHKHDFGVAYHLYCPQTLRCFCGATQEVSLISHPCPDASKSGISCAVLHATMEFGPIIQPRLDTNTGFFYTSQDGWAFVYQGKTIFRSK